MLIHQVQRCSCPDTQIYKHHGGDVITQETFEFSNHDPLLWVDNGGLESTSYVPQEGNNNENIPYHHLFLFQTCKRNERTTTAQLIE
jgi:hypothetical protein